MFSLKLIDEPSLRNKLYVFKDRLDAGEKLALQLEKTLEKPLNGIVLAIPAGGVPVGWMVSKKLKTPLDVLIVRKIQIPWDSEAGFGAVGWNGTTILNQQLIDNIGLTKDEINKSIKLTMLKLEERVKKLRQGKPIPNLEEKVVILVDDGLATGYTMLTAVEIVAKHKPKKIVVASPTGSLSAVNLLTSNPNINLIVCLNIRGGPVFAVADAYENWYDLTDEEVLKYLSSNT
ncbi:MAG: phosphoribosyltransferase [Candidatus Bathyarchaeota archaeon]